MDNRKLTKAAEEYRDKNLFDPNLLYRPREIVRKITVINEKVEGLDITDEMLKDLPNFGVKAKTYAVIYEVKHVWSIKEIKPL